jgi:coenzyme F420-0:L-glutamate ligase/coenzyme F420-1:gamma-L-glutamate ligase
MKRLEIIAVEGIGEVADGDSVGQLIYDACTGLGLQVSSNDIVVVAHKIVSKAEGQIVDLDTVVPSPRALETASQLDKDARLTELILRESRRVIRMRGATIIVETHHGFICANAGVDLSNAGHGRAILLPQNPDQSALRIQEEIRKLAGVAPPIIISDSFGRPWRLGTTDVALGVAGLNPFKDYRGDTDRYGYELRVSMAAVADEIASAAELVMGKKDGIPVVLVRGYPLDSRKGSAQDLLRPEAEDLFRKF